MKVFLSHDVDWHKNVAIEHILKRSERFDQSVLNDVHVKNPYDNILEYMDIEKSLGVKSTFFFKAEYESGSYEDEIYELVKGGWEIGLHSMPKSVYTFEVMKREKKELEKLTKKDIIGNRVHYLGFHNSLPNILNALGFKYDSSMMFSKHEIIPHESFYLNGILELPITWMDAYLFSYMKINEYSMVDMFHDTLAKSKSDVLTLLWHSNVLQMKGGRKYKEILEYFVANDIEIVRGEDLV